VDQLSGGGRGPAAAPLKERSDFLGFLETYARTVGSVRIVVLLDEIGALLPETALRLSSVIRAVFTTRYVKPEFARYVFILAGATDMLELTTGRNSPLKNVADSLYLGDLSAAETQQLVAEMFRPTSDPDTAAIHQTLHAWTGGHPYWTQVLGEAVGPDGTGATEGTVRSIVENLLRTEDRNLPHLFEALDADGTLTQLVEALLGGTPISFSRAQRSIAKLELIGLLKNEKGRCSIRNQIYRTALEQRPVRRPRAPGRDLRRLTQRLMACHNAEALLVTVTADVQAMLQTLSVISLLKPAGENGFSLVSSIGVAEDETLRFDASSSLAQLIGGVVEPGRAPLSDPDRQLLERFGVQLIVPVAVNDEAVAFFWLGPKLSGDEYDGEDREFLTALADHTGRALDRLRLRVLERDAQKAWEIQKALLPHNLPQTTDFQIAASCRPARFVAGDYYDVVTLGERRIAVCIADVMGKGMPAAMQMANLQAAVRQPAAHTTSSNELCADLNRRIAGDVGPGQYVTFFYAVIDAARRLISYSNAGHNPPILVCASGTVHKLSADGPPLGLFPDWNHGGQELTFGPGDRLVLYTDGVTELRNASGDEFGEERLIAIAQSCVEAPDLHQGVVDALQAFTGGAIQDDVTVMAITMR
jgi:hypothetical protein